MLVVTQCIIGVDPCKPRFLFGGSWRKVSGRVELFLACWYLLTMSLPSRNVTARHLPLDGTCGYHRGQKDTRQAHTRHGMGSERPETWRYASTILDPGEQVRICQSHRHLP